MRNSWETKVSKHDDHPLRPRLVETERELQAALEEVCDNPAIPARSTDELIRIEETLAMATDAAKQAVSLRKRIRADGDLLPPVA
jgi:hypothetical protein